MTLLGIFGYFIVSFLEAYYAACYPPNGPKLNLVCHRAEWIIADVSSKIHIISTTKNIQFTDPRLYKSGSLRGRLCNVLLCRRDNALIFLRLLSTSPLSIATSFLLLLLSKQTITYTAENLYSFIAKSI